MSKKEFDNVLEEALVNDYVNSQEFPYQFFVRTRSDGHTVYMYDPADIAHDSFHYLWDNSVDHKACVSKLGTVIWMLHQRHKWNRAHKQKKTFKKPRIITRDDI